MLSGARSLHAGHPCENQDQPSPISVLEKPFEEDKNPARISRISFGDIKPDRHGKCCQQSTIISGFSFLS